MPGYKLATYTSADGPRAGIVVDETIFDAAKLTDKPAYADVILTGTPAGVGSARGEFLKAGDIVRIWIEKIGTLTNKLA